MTSAIRLHVLAAVASMSAPAQAQQAAMSFFVTSVGKGNGADLGGLAGADAHCEALAKAAGSTETNWRAYLSTTEPGGVAGVNARPGPCIIEGYDVERVLPNIDTNYGPELLRL